MVGVAGKSTGCITCRRRKVKCDSEKPACQRCLTSGRHCEGYAKYAVFINNTPTGRIKRKRLEEARPAQPKETQSPWTSSSGSSSSSGASTPAGSKNSDISQYFNPDNLTNHDGYAVTGWALPSPVNTHALVTAGFLGRFVEMYMPSIVSDRHMLKGHWLELAASHAMPGSALELSLVALAWSRAGWYMRDPTLTARSRAIYGRALTLIHEALVDPVARLDEGVLATCRALGIYELYESTTEDVNGFHQHTIGQCKLVQIRGAKSHMSPFAKQLLLDTKYAAMIFALTMRQSSFLADEKWDETLKDDESLKPDLDLAHIGLSLGAILERLDALQRRKNSADKQASLDQVATDLVELRQRLLDWEVYLSTTVSAPLSLVWDTMMNQPADPSTLNLPLPSHYEVTFPSLRIATLMTRSWSIRPILLATLLTLSASVPSSLLSLRTGHTDPRIHLPYPVPLQSSLQVTLKNEAIYIATLVTRSSRFMTDPSRGFMASQNFILPMRVATFVLVGFSKGDPGIGTERDRCIRAYRDLSVGKGLGWAKVIGKVSGDHKVEGQEVTVPEVATPPYDGNREKTTLPERKSPTYEELYCYADKLKMGEEKGVDATT
ncbi:putative transcriptional regulatory protein moc3 [Elsinoe fawcettii]|nr:putative transcriptional regulatory protein moc3 [Elsinoe fawcettii]